MHVELELDGPVNGGVFSRAITFELFSNCLEDPITVCEVLDFGGPFNFPRHATAWLKVPKGNYLCISAKDTLHTLRSCGDIECVDNAWNVTFKGDESLGGNGLVGGNLDCWKDSGHGNTIDVLDAGIYLGIISRNDPDELWHDPSTSCGQDGPDGDINADGHTDSLDYSFILENYLRASKDCCCVLPGSSFTDDRPMVEASVKFLRENGYSTAGDINGDGFLNGIDLGMYLDGHLPVLQSAGTKRAAKSIR